MTGQDGARRYFDREGRPVDLDAIAAQFREAQDARADMIARELAGLTPPEALRRLHGIRAADEAADLAAGWRHLTVTHGPLDDDCIGPFRALCAAIDTATAGLPYRSRGNSDETTWMVQSADAAAIMEDLAVTAAQLDPGWWRIRLST